MCIIADNVKEVSKTKIVSIQAAYTLDNGQTIIPAQLVIYSANIDSDVNSNAIILPIYNPGNNYQNIIPLDLSELPDIITDIANKFETWFPVERKRMWSNSYSFTEQLNSDNLQVFTVGDYKFSIMPSKLDFNRLDRTQLHINPASKVAIDVHSMDYSFIVYQFYQKGKLEITPFGYICPTYGNNSMIIPTIHGHPHDNFTSDFGGSPLPSVYVNYKSDFENEASYDHEIYAVVKSPNPVTNVTKSDVVDIDRIIRKIKKDYMKRNIRIYMPNNFVPKKITLSGYKLNRNLYIGLDGDNFMGDLTLDDNKKN